VIQILATNVTAQIARNYPRGVGGWVYSKDRTLRWQENDRGECKRLQVFDQAFDDSTNFPNYEGHYYYRNVFLSDSVRFRMLGRFHKM
jgi:hypothetical protein